MELLWIFAISVLWIYLPPALMEGVFFLLSRSCKGKILQKRMRLCDDTMELPFDFYENKTVLPSFWFNTSLIEYDSSIFLHVFIFLILKVVSPENYRWNHLHCRPRWENYTCKLSSRHQLGAVHAGPGWGLEVANNAASRQSVWDHLYLASSEAGRRIAYS